MNKFILASKSPRRRELLKQIIPDFDIIDPNIDESKYSLDELSFNKAKKVSLEHKSSFVLAFDTFIKFKDRIILKPKDIDEAREILSLLSDNTHEVITYYTICNLAFRILLTKKVVSYVTFNKLSSKDIENYLKEANPLDKAGGYNILDDSKYHLIKNFEGDINNIAGLPVTSLKQDLIDLKIIDK